MTDDRKSGIALIAGSLGGIMTMAIHPIAGASPTPNQVSHLALASATAHSLAMVSCLLLFLGACGLTIRIVTSDRIAFAALVTYGSACVALLIAAAVSGFIVPGLMSRMVSDSAGAARQWSIVIEGIFQINQAFASIYSVAASGAIVLWSISALRNGGLGRTIAIYGCVTAPLIILGLAVGHLRLDIHGMAVVAGVHALWFIIVGSQLLLAVKHPSVEL